MKTTPLLVFLTLLLSTVAGCISRGEVPQWKEHPQSPYSGDSNSSRLHSVLEHGVDLLLPDGNREAEATGEVVGAEHDYYAVAGKPGDALSVTLQPSNQALYFEVLRSDTGASLFDAGASAVHHWRGGLPVADIYLVRIYLYPSAVRYNERSDYLLHIGITPPSLSGRPLR